MKKIYQEKDLFNLHESALFSRLCMPNAKNQESYYKTCRMNQYYLCQRCNLSIHLGPLKQIPTIPKSEICKYMKNNNFKVPFFSTLIMYTFISSDVLFEQDLDHKMNRNELESDSLMLEHTIGACITGPFGGFCLTFLICMIKHLRATEVINVVLMVIIGLATIYFFLVAFICSFRLFEEISKRTKVAVAPEPIAA
jgi:hypothetical protein